MEIACSKLDSSTLESIKKRVDYYNKLKEPFELSKEAILLSDLKLKNNIKTYFFDLIKYLKYFQPFANLKLVSKSSLLPKTGHIYV